MQLTLLGTGANHCIPAFRCTCSVCREARINRGRYVRQNSCAFIKSKNGNSLLIDMPPQIMNMLASNNIEDSSIDTVLITHRHADHTLGLRYLFQASEKKNFTVKNQTDLYISSSSLKSISGKLLSEKKEGIFTDKKGYYSITPIKDREMFEHKDWIITPVETGHLSEKNLETKEESLGFIIKERGGGTIVYLLDAAVNLPSSTLEILKNTDIDCLVADCTYFKTETKTGHMDIDAVIRLQELTTPSITIASHISHMNLKYRELESILGKRGIITGYDGMVLEI